MKGRCYQSRRRSQQQMPNLTNIITAVRSCVCIAFVMPFFFLFFDTFNKRYHQTLPSSIHQQGTFKTLKVVRNSFALEVVYLQFSLLGKNHLRLSGRGLCVWEGREGAKLSLMEKFEQK